jgi:hypothetical protein
MNRNRKINNRVAQAIRDGYFDDTELNPASDSQSAHNSVVARVDDL